MRVSVKKRFSMPVTEWKKLAKPWHVLLPDPPAQSAYVQINQSARGHCIWINSNVPGFSWTLRLVSLWRPEALKSTHKKQWNHLPPPPSPPNTLNSVTDPESVHIGGLPRFPVNYRLLDPTLDFPLRQYTFFSLSRKLLKCSTSLLLESFSLRGQNELRAQDGGVASPPAHPCSLLWLVPTSCWQIQNWQGILCGGTASPGVQSTHHVICMYT